MNQTLPPDIGIAPCSGRNCGTTTGKHSVDCGLEHTMSCFGVDEAVRVEVWEALDALRLSATARDDALASIRVFAQDCIENGYFDKGALGNLYSIRDLCDSKGEAK